MRVHLLDGTYELFRYHYAPNNDDPDWGATRGVLSTVLSMFEDGVTHLGVATDHVVESFRNDLWPGYKTSAGMPPELLAQFTPIEDALRAMGVVVWAMVEVEADDALGAAAAWASEDDRVELVVICTPDKDLGQCVVDNRVVQLDRRRQIWIDEAAVKEKFGVMPASVPDWLALVGDSADGFPGLSGWGAKSSGVVLGRYGHIEDIPTSASEWDVNVRGAAKLAATLADEPDLALLFRRIATVERDTDLATTVDDLEWAGPQPEFEELAKALGSPGLWRRAVKAAGR